ncbi:hypothetical protein [Methylomonas sp. AM2-LC]|uniref:hypothetical protein n=1 Tax=Methylomonas sp. AM2-LC TaxID=3153301 RepID=UPI0032648F0C
MARPLRIELAGGLYHVTSRGNARDDIFLDDDDRLCWLEIFGQVCERFNSRGHKKVPTLVCPAWAKTCYLKGDNRKL